MSGRLFWVVYDYGQGGRWAIVRAESAEEIGQRYPSLQVFDAPPIDLDVRSIELIRAAGILDINELPTGWMEELAR